MKFDFHITERGGKSPGRVANVDDYERAHGFRRKTPLAAYLNWKIIDDRLCRMNVLVVVLNVLEYARNAHKR